MSGQADPASAKAALLAKAAELGFDAIGVTEAEWPKEERDDDATPAHHLRDYLTHGHHGDMAWMEDRADQRASPNALWADACSVISVGVNYGSGANMATDLAAELANVDSGVVSLYARRKDYHDIIKKRLKVLARWLHQTYGVEVKVFVDTAPVMEKPLAARAGLGWQGKHTCLVSREFGTWLFLGAIYTEMALPPDTPHDDRCGSCSACMDACPTDAFPAPYKLDARRCIAYLTIEYQGHIAPEFRAGIGNRIFGCDDCLAACPWNRFAQTSQTVTLAVRDAIGTPRLSDILALDDAAFREMFKGTPVKRTGRDRVVRNALIAAGNSRNPGFLSAIEGLLDDPSPLVRAMAVWASGELADRARFDALRTQYQDTEEDMDVRAEWGR